MLVLFKTKLDARTQTTADAKLVRLCDRQGQRQRGRPSKAAPAPRTDGRDRMIKIAIGHAAFEAIAATLPLGTVGYENQTKERGERAVWLEPNVVSGLT
jgi:hypothetical protein